MKKSKSLNLLHSFKSVSRAVTRDDEEEPAMNICGPTDFQHEGHMGFSEKGIEVICLISCLNEKSINET